MWKSEANEDTCEQFTSLLSTGQNISKMYKDILTGSKLVNLSKIICPVRVGISVGAFYGRRPNEKILILFVCRLLRSQGRGKVCNWKMWFSEKKIFGLTYSALISIHHGGKKIASLMYRKYFYSS